MTLTGVSLATLPKSQRTRELSSEDQAAAESAYALASVENQGVSDGVTYTDTPETENGKARTGAQNARAAAAKITRLVRKVAPAGIVTRSRTYPVGDGFAFVVWTAPEKPAKGKGKATK